MLLVVLISSLVHPCLFGLPADGPVVRDFAPVGSYGGHWGVDVSVSAGSPVRAAADGIVTFSGQVAGRSTVTVSLGGLVRTSYSYLSDRSVAEGQRVGRGGIVGLSGWDHGLEAIHFSLRVGDRYLDPLQAGCGVLSPGHGVRLAAAA
jgi:murein DD-endopeptidase MepM/ murein hydrolase activator NlpD